MPKSTKAKKKVAKPKTEVVSKPKTAAAKAPIKIYQDGIQKLQAEMQLLKVMHLWIKVQLYQSLKFSSSIYTKN